MTLLDMHSIFLYVLQFIFNLNVLYTCLLAYQWNNTCTCLLYNKYGLLTASITDRIELLLFQACKFIYHVISSSFPKLILHTVKCHWNSQVFFLKKCLFKMTNAAFLFILLSLIWIRCMYNSVSEWWALRMLYFVRCILHFILIWHLYLGWLHLGMLVYDHHIGKTFSCNLFPVYLYLNHISAYYC